jgi:cell division protein FtsB
MINDPTTTSTIAQWGAGLVVAIVGLVLTVQKMMRGWSSDKAARVGDDAYTQIVTALRDELERLHKQNTALAEQLNKMQLEMANVVQTNINLQAEVERLRDEIARMHNSAE